MEILTGEKNEKLRIKAKAINRITKDIHILANDMKEVMKKHAGVGLAATQVDSNSRMIVCDLDLSGENISVFINPEIVKFSKDKEIKEEGCLSLPGMWADVERPKTITLRAKTLEGKKIKKRFGDIKARILQHEVDHLDGILFIDKEL